MFVLAKLHVNYASKEYVLKIASVSLSQCLDLAIPERRELGLFRYRSQYMFSWGKNNNCINFILLSVLHHNRDIKVGQERLPWWSSG